LKDLNEAKETKFMLKTELIQNEKREKHAVSTQVLEKLNSELTRLNNGIRLIEQREVVWDG